jgi:hypothetical protein
LRLEEMQRSSHRPGLDQASVAERTIDLALSQRLAPHTDCEFGGRRNLRLHSTETGDDLGDGEATDRIQEVTAHPPRQGLLPGDPDGHPLSVVTPLAASR